MVIFHSYVSLPEGNPVVYRVKTPFSEKLDTIPMVGPRAVLGIIKPSQ